MQKAFFFVGAAAVFLLLASCSQGTGSSTAGAAPAAGAQAVAATPGGSAARGGNGGGGQGGRRFATIPVQAITVKSTPLVTDNDTAGTVVASTQSQVAAQVAGVVAKVFFRQGDWVKEGETVVQLDDSSLKLALKNAQSALDNAKINLTMGQQTTSGSSPKLQSQLDSAQAALASAQKNYDSQKAQYALGGISGAALDNANSALQQAQANVEAAKLALDQNAQSDTQNIAQLKLSVDQAGNQLELAQLNLRNASIRAPFAGQLAAVNVTPGMYVSLNTGAFLLVSADKQINFTMPPMDAPNFKIGDTVLFNVSGRSYPVRIIQTPSAPVNGVVPMAASISASVPAAFGTVGTITYKITIGMGPQVPVASLQSQASTNFVYTVVNGKAAAATVTILAEAGDTAVVQGVNPGDQVIISPPPGLLAGSTVQVVALPAAQGPTSQGQNGQKGAVMQGGPRTGNRPGSSGASAGGRPQPGGSSGAGRSSSGSTTGGAP